MSHAIIWCRVSTTAQEFESQKKELIETALKDGFQKEDLIIIGEAGASAIKMNDLYQKEVNQLVEAIDKTDTLSTIYVWEVSRLARNEVAFYQMKDKIIKNKIQLKCNVPQIKLLDDNGEVNQGMEITLNLLVTLAKQEMDIKAKRFARGKKQKAEEGKYNGGAIPYGYRVDETRGNLIVVNEKEAEIVQLVFDLYETGFSQPKLAKELRKRGYNDITISMIHHILKNSSYCGVRKKSPSASYERAYPPIISKKQFEKCRSIANNNNTTINKSRNIYYADKLVKCPTCGGYWSASGSKNSYHCTTAYRSNSIWNYENHNKDKCKNKTSLSINVLDSILWHYSIERECAYILNQNEKAIKLYEEARMQIKQKLANIEPRRNELQLKKERLREMYVDGMSKESYNKKKKKIDEETIELRNEELQYNKELSNIDNQMSLIKKKNPVLWNRRDREQLIQEISNISDDKERYDIIHRQVRSVEVLSKRASFPFKIGRRDIAGKYIVIHGIPIYGFETFDLIDKDFDICAKGYFSIPNGGNGALILELFGGQEQCNLSESIYIYDEDMYFSYKEIQDKIYLNRFYDVTKKTTREKEREEKARVIGDRLTLKELSDLCGLSYITLYNKVKNGKIKAVMEYGKYLIDPKDALDICGKMKENGKID